MPANRDPKVTAVVSASGLTIMLAMVFVADNVWPWRIVFGALALLLVIKLVVVLRAARPNVGHFEQTLRRLAFVDRHG